MLSGLLSKLKMRKRVLLVNYDLAPRCDALKSEIKVNLRVKPWREINMAKPVSGPDHKSTDPGGMYEAAKNPRA